MRYKILRRDQPLIRRTAALLAPEPLPTDKSIKHVVCHRLPERHALETQSVNNRAERQQIETPAKRAIERQIGNRALEAIARRTEVLVEDVSPDVKHLRDGRAIGRCDDVDDR